MLSRFTRALKRATIRGAFFCASFGCASASLIVSTTPFLDTGTGFGNVPNVLTVQAAPTESGCVAWDGSTTIFGASACAIYGSTYAGGDEPNNPVPNKVYAPTAGELGIGSLSDLQIIFNANQTGNSTDITIDNLTLAIFDNSGAVVYMASLANPVTLDSTLQGVGQSGFSITIAADQIPAGFTFAPTYRIGLAANLGCFAGATGCSNAGPDTFSVSSIANPQAVPEPATWGLIAAGLIGLGLLRKRK